MQTVRDFFVALGPCALLLLVGLVLAWLVYKLNQRRGRVNELEALFSRGVAPPSHEPVDDLGDLIDLFEQIHDND